MVYGVLVIKSEVNSAMFGAVRSKMAQAGKTDYLYVVLETLGGNQTYAYRTMAYLDSIQGDTPIYAVIPNYAMSAGTLMALGADKIYMRPESCIGPLDPQRKHFNDDSTISTLDIRDSISTISAQAVVTMMNMFAQGVRIGLSKTVASNLASDTATKLLSPLVSKIDPYHLNESVRVSELNLQYGARLLSSRMIKDDVGRVSKISSHLTNGYPNHEYAIVMSEAKEIGLSVDSITSVDDWSNINKIYLQLEKKQKDGIIYNAKEKGY